MKDLIKQIRNYVKLTQTEMAEKLSVNFVTLNRWENGHAMPNRVVQDRLIEFCDKNSVPVYSFIINKINACTAEINTDGIILYHGSKSGINGKIAPISRERCDFGNGFYMGTEAAQPLTLISDFPESEFYILSLSLKGMNVAEIPANIDWAMTVAYHRGKMEQIKGSSFYEKYRLMTENKDIIIGSIANDRMFFVIDNFFQGNITDIALINSLSSLQLGKQYVALTHKACEAIKIEKKVELSYFEKKILQNENNKNRQQGISLANEICKTYRREGKFFDEILKEIMDGNL